MSPSLPREIREVLNHYDDSPDSSPKLAPLPETDRCRIRQAGSKDMNLNDLPYYAPGTVICQ